jgi:NAD-dependent deacetylase
MLSDKVRSALKKAVTVLKQSKYNSVLTGAGISVESGIPPFRGEGGLWNKIEPKYFDIVFFNENPLESWRIIKDTFYSLFDKVEANLAHQALAKMEANGLLKSVITQNIDNLHQLAGSKNIIEFHGNSKKLTCTKCHFECDFSSETFKEKLPICKECSGVLKPNFVFFGESISKDTIESAFMEAEMSDVFIIIGTTGEVQPAATLPVVAKEKGATIIEINTHKSLYTKDITDIFLNGRATLLMDELLNMLF